MRNVRSEYLDFFLECCSGFLRPDDAFSFHILLHEVAELFDTFFEAIFRNDKPSLISIVTLSLISKEWSFLRHFSKCMLERKSMLNSNFFNNVFNVFENWM